MIVLYFLPIVIALFASLTFITADLLSPESRTKLARLNSDRTEAGQKA